MRNKSFLNLDIKSKTFFRGLILSGLAIFLIFANSFLKTGCFFYGLKNTCFSQNKISWVVNFNKIEEHREIASKWAKGFYHTGDIGYLDKDGFLTITGRIKEILITAGGENVAPVLIENNIKKELSDIISNVVVIGDQKKFLSCLITLKVELNDEIPTNELDTALQFYLYKKHGIDVKTVEDARTCSNFRDMIWTGIESANLKAISKAQTIKKFTILSTDFSVPTGELTPTLKLKRPIIVQKNKEVIDNLYT